MESMIYNDVMIILTKASKELIPEVLDYYRRNRTFLAPYEGVRDDSFYTAESIDRLIGKAIKNEKERTGVRFYITLPGSSRIIGTIALTDCSHGQARGVLITKSSL